MVKILHKSLFDNMPDGLAYCQMIFDPQGNPIDFIYVEVNKSFEELTGLKDVVQKKVTELIPGITASNPELLEVYGRVSLTGEPERFETYVELLSRWFSVSVYSPKKIFFVSIFQNITARKQLEKDLLDARVAAQNVFEDLSIEKSKLEIAKAKDEAILGGIGDGVFVIDETGVVILFNRVAEEISGWRVAEALGQQYQKTLKFATEDESDAVKDDFISQALQGKKMQMSNHAVIIRKDGTKLPVADSATPILNDAGKVQAVAVVFRDVTKERAVDKAKTEFVSLASHQLRTPLSTINWYVEMLLSPDIGELTPKQRQYSQEVYRASKRMVTLVNALLNVSRLELGTFAIEPKLVNIVKIAKVALEELQPQILKKKLTVTEDYGKTIFSVKVDPELLAIIFQNLLSNAIKYSKDGGEVGFAISKKEDSIMIVVSDTGVGIPISQQKDVFGKLFRADNAKQIDPDGSGLGLYIVKKIIDHGGGKVWFESSVEKGTIFYVTFPSSGMIERVGSKELI